MNDESIFGWLDNPGNPEDPLPGENEQPQEVEPGDGAPNDEQDEEGQPVPDDGPADNGPPLPPPAPPQFDEQTILSEMDFGYLARSGRQNIYFFDKFRNFLHYRYVVSRYCNWMMQREENRRVFRSLFNEHRVRSLLADNTWFGPQTTYEDLIHFRYRFFQRPDLIEEVYQTIRAQIPRDLISEIPVAKLTYSENRGIFVFDRAAMGFKKIHQYRDLKENVVVPFDEVLEFKPGKFRTRSGNKVEREVKMLPNGRPAATSSNKKSFAYFEKKKKRILAVTIYSILSLSSMVPAAELIYAGLSAAVLARILLEKGYRVEINGVVGVFEGPNTILDIIPAKRFNTTLDISQVAFVLSDARFFRWDGFMGLISSWDKIGVDSDYRIGTPISLPGFQSIRTAAARYFEIKYPNTLMAFMGGQTNARSAADSITRTIRDLINSAKNG
jgi:hypothetical protein